MSRVVTNVVIYLRTDCCTGNGITFRTIVFLQCVMQCDAFLLSVTKGPCVFADRQRYIEIRVGDKPISTATSPKSTGNELCWSDLSGTVLTNITTASCTNPYGITGRYVSIQIIGVTQYLTLCEVKVFGPSRRPPVPPAPPPSPPPPTGMVELARGRAAYQSSTPVPTGWGLVGCPSDPACVAAGKAVDGNRDQLQDRSPYCASTAAQPNPWW